jgi:cytochrome c oxidase subunit 1
MLITTIPWHIAGLMGQPRRIATFDYTDPLIAPMAPLVVISVIGGLILLVSAILLIVILVRAHFGERAVGIPLGYALAVNPPVRVPPSLNGFGLWNAILAVFMIVAYGYPIGQFFVLKQHSVQAVEVTNPSWANGSR